MLYDQSLLIAAATEAFQVTGREEFRRTVEETTAYVRRELVSPEGGFWTSEDADSNGEEGRYYLWEAAEVRDILEPAEAELAVRLFGLDPEGDAGPDGGKCVLSLKKEPHDLAGELGISEDELLRRSAAVSGRLLAVRERRPRPFKDTKILTDWNGLMIAALAKAARALDRDEFAAAALRAAAFIKERLTSGGILRHRYADGEAAIAAFLDDYAFLIWGLIEVYETGYDPGHLAWALRLTNELMDGFWDEARGGFFLTGRETRDLPWRRKEFTDGALPSGNSVMVANLLRLGRLTGRPELERAAARTVEAMAGSVSRAPEAHAQFLCGLDLALGPSREVVIVGQRHDPGTRRFLEPLRRRFLPRVSVLFRPRDKGSPSILEIAPYARAMTGVEGLPTAYICSGNRCEQPTTDPKIMLEALESHGPGSMNREREG
jgi:hypothetical protein